MPTLNWIRKEKVMTHLYDVPFHVLDHKYGFDSSNPGNSQWIDLVTKIGKSGPQNAAIVDVEKGLIEKK